MTRATTNLPGVLALLQSQWRAIAPRERMLVRVASSVMVVAMLWWVAVAPALVTLQNAETQRRTLGAELQLMQNLQAQAKTLQAQPTLSRDDALRALETSVKQTLGASAQLSIAGDRATVSLRSTSPEALAQWLAQARVNARALPIEARLARATINPSTPAPTPTPTPTPNPPLSPPPSSTSPVLGWSGTLVLNLPAP